MRNNLDLLDEKNDQVKLYCYSVFVWSALFGVLQDKFVYPNITSRLTVDVNNRLISILHGQITLWFCVILIMTEHPTLAQKNTYSMNFIMIVSGGYFTYDLFVCLYYNLYDVWLILHHFASIMAYTTSILTQYTGTIAIKALMYAEIPNLPMHLRRIIKNLGYRHTKLYEVIEITYIMFFVVCRGALTPPLLIQAWKDINSSLIVKLVGTVLLIQAIYYIYEMKQIMRKKYLQYLERQKKKVHYNWFSVTQSLGMLNYPKYEGKDTIL